MQKYKFTCLHMELKSTTLQCEPIQTHSCMSKHTPHISCRERSSCWLRWWQRSSTLELSGTLFFIAGLSHPGCKSLSSFLPHLRASSFKKIRRFWKQASLRSTLFREGLWHYKDNIWAQHHRRHPRREKAVVVSPPASVSFPATAASHQGTSHAILRSNLWPERHCPATGASHDHCWRIKPCLTCQLAAIK